MRILKILGPAALALVLAASPVYAQRRDPVAELIGLLKNDDVSVRRAAAFSLKYFPNDEAAIPALIGVLDDADSRVRDNAGDALALMYPREAVPALVAATRNANALTRQKAAETLGRFAEHAAPAVPSLILLLRDDNAVVRQAATVALRRIQGGGWQ